MSGSAELPFLPALAAAARAVNEEGAEVTTEAFAQLMDVVVRTAPPSFPPSNVLQHHERLGCRVYHD